MDADDVEMYGGILGIALCLLSIPSIWFLSSETYTATEACEAEYGYLQTVYSKFQASSILDAEYGCVQIVYIAGHFNDEGEYIPKKRDEKYLGKIKIKRW